MTDIPGRPPHCPRFPQNMKFMDKAGAVAHINRTALAFDTPRVAKECTVCGWWHVHKCEPDAPC